MEYVDGEDLASLLRRIGRFPQDKAIEVARQICAGRRRRARARRAAPRSEAGQRDDRRRRARPHHRLRPRGDRRQRRRHPRRHAGLHGAGAARRHARSRRAATSTRSAWCCSSCSPASASSRPRTLNELIAAARVGRVADAFVASSAISIRRSSGRSCAASSASRRSGRRRRSRCRRRCPAAISSPRRWPPAKRRRRRWSPRPASRARCSRRSASALRRVHAGDAGAADVRLASGSRSSTASRCRGRPTRWPIARRSCSSGSATATRRPTRRAAGCWTASTCVCASGRGAADAVAGADERAHAARRSSGIARARRADRLGDNNIRPTEADPPLTHIGHAPGAARPAWTAGRVPRDSAAGRGAGATPPTGARLARRCSTPPG